MPHQLAFHVKLLTLYIGFAMSVMAKLTTEGIE
jgi:hypothetical protein